jgi:hypothetical protein
LSDGKEKEDAKFIALVATVKELAKSVSKTGENTDTQKSKWKFEAPSPGASIEKEVNGKTFWWCTGLDGKHHKPMYCCHKPQDCKAQDKDKSTKSVSFSDDTAENKSKSSAPKLKLNSNVATALAALDGALKQSTKTDPDETREDFQNGV